MPKDLRKQIETHLATWPERHQDVLEMRAEWADFKSKMIWLGIGFLSTILAIGIWVGTVQSEIEGLSSDINESLAHHDEYEKRLGALEINNGEIRSRLTSIEVTLQEIKAAIIKLQ